MYRVEVYDKAKKKLQKLNKETYDRVLKAFDKLKEPFKLDIKKMASKGDFYRVRIGRYRAIIWVEFDNKIVYVVDFDIRGRIY